MGLKNMPFNYLIIEDNINNIDLIRVKQRYKDLKTANSRKEEYKKQNPNRFYKIAVIIE